MRGRTEKYMRGFTLIEIILASIILCASVLALGAICTRALGGTKLNRQYETAAGLAQKQLILIDYIGINNFIESDRTKGDFENLQPTYHWQVTTESLGIDNLYQVKVAISWIEHNQEFEIAVETRLNGTSELIEITGQ